MVYSFFDPDSDRRSLGTFLILDHIAKAQTLAFLMSIWLLGRRIAQDGLQCRFTPQERLTPEGWARPCERGPGSTAAFDHAGLRQSCLGPMPAGDLPAATDIR